MSDSDDEFDNEYRAEQIAKSGFDVGRYPLDSAGMDTDDEIWVDEHQEYNDYIIQVYRELKDNEECTNQDAAIMIQKYARRLIVYQTLIFLGK